MTISMCGMTSRWIGRSVGASAPTKISISNMTSRLSALIRPRRRPVCCSTIRAATSAPASGSTPPESTSTRRSLCRLKNTWISSPADGKNTGSKIKSSKLFQTFKSFQSFNPLLHPYIRFVADCHRGDHCYVTPISRACWNEDHLHPIPNYEDQGETVASSERTELKVQ